jgi:hypothetical protein
MLNGWQFFFFYNSVTLIIIVFLEYTLNMAFQLVDGWLEVILYRELHIFSSLLQ